MDHSTTRTSRLALFQFYFALVFWLIIWWFFSVAAGQGGGAGAGLVFAIYIYPFYLVLTVAFFISTVVTLVKKKRGKIYSILGTLIFTYLFWGPYVSFAYTKYVKPVSSCQLADTERRNACFYHMAVARKDVKLCNAISGNQGFKTFCEENVIIARDGLEGCRGFPDLDTRDNCLWAFARSKKNMSICDEITNFYDKRGCLELFGATMVIDEKIHYAQVFKRLCESIPNKDEIIVFDRYTQFSRKDHCYSSYAFERRDGNLCDGIDNLSYRNDCYRARGIENNDRSVCEKIPLSPEAARRERETCLRSLRP